MADPNAERTEAGRRLHIPIHLRWGDLDAYNHVNNVSMLKILEEVRIRALWAGDEDPQTYPTAVLNSGAGGEVQSILARQEIEYLAPVLYQPEPLDVELWFGRLGGSSVEICYEVYTPIGIEPRVLYARASATLVLASIATGKPVRLTPEIRAAWTPFVGEPIRYTRR